MSKFWLVWNEQGHAPTHKHDARNNAVIEAERLARQNPQHRFHVLEWCGTCTKRDVIWQTPNSMDDDIPF